MADRLFSRPNPAVDVRCIHLDLKGMPPTAERLLQLPAILGRMRVNALLIEWEDAYPWKVHAALRSPTAYDRETVLTFLGRLLAEGIEPIPLVQCIGHLENVLLRAEFAGLREVPENVAELCPLHAESAPLVLRLIDDVLETHRPYIRRFHLGGDEAWTLGSCERCRPYVTQHGKCALYLHHVDPLIEHLNMQGIRALLWDDELREASLSTLRSLQGRADLVAWRYDPDIYAIGFNPLKPYHLDRYAAAGVEWWAGPAFKKTSDGDVPDLARAMGNTAAWLEALERTPAGREKRMISTGWSRGDFTRSARCGLEPAWDAVVLAAAQMWDGTLPEDAVEAARDFLAEGPLAEMVGASFAACREAALRVSQWNERISADPQWVRMEHQAAVSFEPERLNPFGLGDRWGGGALRQELERGLALGEQFIEAHRGLVPEHWLRIYVRARVEHKVRRYNALVEGLPLGI